MYTTIESPFNIQEPGPKKSHSPLYHTPVPFPTSCPILLFSHRILKLDNTGTQFVVDKNKIPAGNEFYSHLNIWPHQMLNQTKNSRSPPALQLDETHIGVRFKAP